MNNKLSCCPLCKEKPNLILTVEGAFLNCPKECKENIKIQLLEEKDTTLKIFKQRAIDIWNMRVRLLENE